jgi:hypothetical protein
MFKTLVCLTLLLAPDYGPCLLGPLRRDILTLLRYKYLLEPTNVHHHG